MDKAERYLPTVKDLQRAETIIRSFLSPTPLIRSHALESILRLPKSRRVWIKDYGWTPVGSFKVLGALNWMANQPEDHSQRPVAAHSSGNFASGISFAAKQFNRRCIIVMPQSAPMVKFELTKSFGAEIRTYDIQTDAITGVRDSMTREIAIVENGVQASPYDDPFVIAGNGVGGLEIVRELESQQRKISHFICPVSGGGLMAGHAIAIGEHFPLARQIGVEPEDAADFKVSLLHGSRTRIPNPKSICDGLLSYDVGEHNWPILSKYVDIAFSVPDIKTKIAMKWLWKTHGLRTEPSGAISVAAVLDPELDLSGDGDIVLVISGRNIDQSTFDQYCLDVPSN